MSDVFSTFEAEVESRHKEMLDDLESISAKKELTNTSNPLSLN